MTELERYDVIITSYGTLTPEYPIKKYGKPLTEDERYQDELRIDRNKGILFRVEFERLVIDEAHTIKSPGAIVSVATYNLRSVSQWCLTGTPLVNKVDDIYPLLRVLQVSFFRERKSFRNEISRSRQGATKLREILAPYLKRRTKDEKIAGLPVLTLPEKHLIWVDLKLDDDESSLYKQVEERMVSQINKYLREGIAVKRVNDMFVMLLRLRQRCIHPYLILEHLASKSNITSENLAHTGQKQDYTQMLLAEGFSMSNTTICVYCETEAGGPMITDKCKHCFCQQCMTAHIDDLPTPCPVCEEPIRTLRPFDGKTEASSLICDGMNTSGQSRTQAVPSPYETRSSSPVLSCASSDDKLTAMDGVTPSATRTSRYATQADESDDDDDELPDFNMQIALKLSEGRKPAVSSSPAPISQTSFSTSPSASFQPDVKPAISSSSFSGLTSPSSSRYGVQARSPKPHKDVKPQTSDTSKRYTVDAGDVLEKAPGMSKEERKAEFSSWQEVLKLPWMPSTKLTAVEDRLKEWMVMDGSKLIIFSQFVKALGLISKMCESHGWEALRYQGNMSMREREETIMKFEESDGPRILLMSLKAGGVGLNLTCANKVIMLDFWWNAAAELYVSPPWLVSFLLD